VKGPDLAPPALTRLTEVLRVTAFLDTTIAPIAPGPHLGGREVLTMPHDANETSVRGEPGLPDSGGPLTFTDSLGVTWTVREITPAPMPPKLLKMLGDDRRRGGWLLFWSAEGEKRRLSPVPQNWSSLSRFELERWCMGASRVPPAPEQRAADRSPSA